MPSPKSCFSRFLSFFLFGSCGRVPARFPLREKPARKPETPVSGPTTPEPLSGPGRCQIDLPAGAGLSSGDSLRACATGSNYGPVRTQSIGIPPESISRGRGPSVQGGMLPSPFLQQAAREPCLGIRPISAFSSRRILPPDPSMGRGFPPTTSCSGRRRPYFEIPITHQRHQASVSSLPAESGDSALTGPLGAA